jgi:hypothetical protein
MVGSLVCMVAVVGIIYQMERSSCQLKYVGQTGRNFKTRYKEHTQEIRLVKLTYSYDSDIA